MDLAYLSSKGRYAWCRRPHLDDARRVTAALAVVEGCRSPFCAPAPTAGEAVCRRPEEMFILGVVLDVAHVAASTARTTLSASSSTEL
jgi:hypothetical protein